jgi:hypothetical protein
MLEVYDVFPLFGSFMNGDCKSMNVFLVIFGIKTTWTRGHNGDLIEYNGI